jgi:hypothetical protein
MPVFRDYSPKTGLQRADSSALECGTPISYGTCFSAGARRISQKDEFHLCCRGRTASGTDCGNAPARLIYPDTIIWNLLCDQKIHPDRLIESLRTRRATLVVSFHTVYELARNFKRDEAAGNARGQQLFSYLKQYLDLGIASTKQLWELIVAEAFAFENHLTVIDSLARSEEAAIEKQEVEKLANGIVEGRVKNFLEERKQFASDTQTQQEARIIESDKLREYLRTISESEVDAGGDVDPIWLQYAL